MQQTLALSSCIGHQVHVYGVYASSPLRYASQMVHDVQLDCIQREVARFHQPFNQMIYEQRCVVSLYRLTGSFMQMAVLIGNWCVQWLLRLV